MRDGAPSLRRWWGWGVGVLIANTAYLAAFASPTPFYFANVVLHMLLGLALAVSVAPSMVRAFGQLSIASRVGSVLAGAGAIVGVAIMVAGAAGRFRWLLPTHIVLMIAGLVPLLAEALVATLGRRTRWQWAIGGTGVLIAGGTLVFATTVANDARAARHRIANPEMVPASMDREGAGPDSPFFPSSSETNTGGVIPATFFLTSESCGRCHTEIYNEWQSSAHHFSSFNNQWYRKSIEYMQDVVGTKPSKWCAGCHDHAVFFNGRFDRPIKEQIETPEAQAGLGCTSCHAITRVKSTMGQGDFEVSYPPLHDLAASDHQQRQHPGPRREEGDRFLRWPDLPCAGS